MQAYHPEKEALQPAYVECSYPDGTVDVTFEEDKRQVFGMSPQDPVAPGSGASVVSLSGELVRWVKSVSSVRGLCDVFAHFARRRHAAVLVVDSSRGTSRDVSQARASRRTKKACARKRISSQP